MVSTRRSARARGLPVPSSGLLLSNADVKATETAGDTTGVMEIDGAASPDVFL